MCRRRSNRTQPYQNVEQPESSGNPVQQRQAPTPAWAERQENIQADRNATDTAQACIYCGYLALLFSGCCDGCMSACGGGPTTQTKPHLRPTSAYLSRKTSITFKPTARPELLTTSIELITNAFMTQMPQMFTQDDATFVKRASHYISTQSAKLGLVLYVPNFNMGAVVGAAFEFIERGAYDLNSPVFMTKLARDFEILLRGDSNASFGGTASAKHRSSQHHSKKSIKTQTQGGKKKYSKTNKTHTGQDGKARVVYTDGVDRFVMRKCQNNSSFKYVKIASK
jgi:hypothetical protein